MSHLRVDARAREENERGSEAGGLGMKARGPSWEKKLFCWLAFQMPKQDLGLMTLRHITSICTVMMRHHWDSGTVMHPEP